MNELKYYKVTAKCGHVGKSKYIPIEFPILALNGKEAAKICRNIPRVKHNHKDAILNCCEISYEEYLLLQFINSNDEYLKCNKKSEQSKIEDLDKRMKDDMHNTKIKHDKKEREARVKRKLLKYKEMENTRWYYRSLAKLCY